MNSTTIAENPATPNAPKESTDLLVWLGGLVFVGLGMAWLLVTQPWASNESKPFPDLKTESQAPAEAAPSEAETGTEAGPRTELVSTLDDPLRMAGLAFEAGMLLQPESLSAWSLYLKAFRADATNDAARRGLDDVADALLARAAVALEQDRTDDAAKLVNTVLAELPDHPEAKAMAQALPAALLANRPVSRTSQPKPRIAKPTPAPASKPKIDNKPRLARASKPRNVLAEASASFETALAENRLLSPKDDNARHYLGVMQTANRDDEGVLTAQRALFDRLMNRAAEATESADEQAAEAWLAAADELALDAAAVATARASLEKRLIQLATARPIPVSELTLLDYTPPDYPNRALNRDIEGWVDVEFTVTADGTPVDVSVVNASHDRYFREEAIAAVGLWRFEPRQVRGRSVDQRTFTRLSFKLQ